MSRRFETWRIRGVQGRRIGDRKELMAESRRATQTQDCGTCNKPKGERCVSGNGNPVPPHFWRLVRLRKAEGRA